MLTYRIEDGRRYGEPNAVYVVMVDGNSFEKEIGITAIREYAVSLCAKANVLKSAT